MLQLHTSVLDLSSCHLAIDYLYTYDIYTYMCTHNYAAAHERVGFESLPSGHGTVSRPLSMPREEHVRDIADDD